MCTERYPFIFQKERIFFVLLEKTLYFLLFFLFYFAPFSVLAFGNDNETYNLLDR